jgi:hypothetical protein
MVTLPGASLRGSQQTRAHQFHDASADQRHVARREQRALLLLELLLSCQP